MWQHQRALLTSARRQGQPLPAAPATSFLQYIPGSFQPVMCEDNLASRASTASPSTIPGQYLMGQ